MQIIFFSAVIVRRATRMQEVEECAENYFLNFLYSVKSMRNCCLRFKKFDEIFLFFKNLFKID